MHSKPPPMQMLIVIIVMLACMQGVATYWDLYFYIWWLDIPMHLIGGFWISAATLTFRAMRAPTVIDSVPLLLAYAVTATLVIGLGWEVFEWGVDRMNGLVHFDLVDTSADMGNDLIGALFAAWVFLRTRYNKAI